MNAQALTHRPSPRFDAAATLALGATWLWLFAPTLKWLAGLAHEEYRLSLALLIAAGAAFALRARSAIRDGALRGAWSPLFRPLPIALTAFAALSYLAVERWLDVDILSAALFALGTYGLLGLFVPDAAWRRAGPAALLLAAALPFGHHLNVYVGFPARVVTAEVVHRLFASAGISSLPANGILVLENGVANVDLPCSGLKSLWAGALFLLAVTCLEQRKVGLTWLGVAVTQGLVALTANVGRVAAVVLLAVVARRPDLADLVHVPLGVAGFLLACGAGFLLLRLCPLQRPSRALSRSEAAPRPGSPRLAVGLAALALGLAALRSPRPADTERFEVAFNFPAEFHTSPLALTPAEEGLLGQHGGGHAKKVRFDWRGVTGSLLLAPTASWRSHHPPEQCLVSSGLVLDSLAPREFAPGLTAQVLSLDHGSRAAAYWFQSATTTTPLLLERIRAQALGGQNRWVMVSVLLDGPLAESTAPLAAQIRDVVARSLEGNTL
jgi:exosortase O